MNKLQELFEGSAAIAEDNLGFLEDLFARFQEDPESVDRSWRDKFSALQGVSLENRLDQDDEDAISRPGAINALALRQQAAVDRLMMHFRTRGHQVAENNPLRNAQAPTLKHLDPAYYGFTERDFDQLFYIDILHHQRQLPLREILNLLNQTYCKSIGAEYMHIVDADVRVWIQQRLENSRGQAFPDPEHQKALLKTLTAAEGIEQVLHRQYVGQKRFSLEGAESLIPLLDEIIERASEKGVVEMVIGMAHRGRLNVLVNLFGKRPRSLFQEFEGTHPASPLASAGDVKYHTGFSSNIQTHHGPVHIALAFNPSHLEIIDPVVEGSVRARQDRRSGQGEEEVMAILIHGDAAFAGQGVVMETLNMAETRAYTTGGTIHVVINNQIGFTTSNPFDARSTLYCTDVANMVQAPVFHVNGDDPEAVLFVTRLAVDYRMKFKRDVVIDMLCYRRHGHNEADEPAVTQPMMYRFIRQHASVRRLYAQRLIDKGLITSLDERQLELDYQMALSQDEIVSRPLLEGEDVFPKPSWQPYQSRAWRTPHTTSLPRQQLTSIALEMLRLPEGFALHPRAQAIYDSRRSMALGERPIDWGFGEMLAYASLLKEGTAIRLTGQDVGRGTFFHRHAIVHDQEKGIPYTPLHHLAPPSASFQIYDSILSEEGVLGFEYGYASSAPEVLVIWEAQFGDFANNAQVVIDQFIASGESKWGRLCGLTLLLPHGYEGQGPEHSSARIERYLQLCAEDNMQVTIPTTPAQIFHLLRRQIRRPFRKPLIVMTPKSLLRHKQAASSLDELENGAFLPVIGDITQKPKENIRRVILSSGKIYYDLQAARDDASLDHVALIRVEQLYPFPDSELLAELAQYPSMDALVWCQEEPENQGAWRYIQHHCLNQAPSAPPLQYAGRAVSAAPAVGQYQRHIVEQKRVVDEALKGPLTPTG